MPILATRALASARGFGFAGGAPFKFSISSNQTNANLRTLAVNAGWDQSRKLIATISSGIYISSNSTGTPALTVSGSFPSGVELINNGFIVGMGGNGGAGCRWDGAAGSAGSSGGLALSVSSAISITNSGTIGGGGGGGGGGQAGRNNSGLTSSMSGGGGGGGRSSNAANSSGGIGHANERGKGTPSGGGGSGTVSTAGAGGSGGNAGNTATGGIGGSGGGWGASGATGGSASASSGFGPLISSGGPFSGGGGGAAVSGNSNITWLATGTRLGAIA